MVGQFARCPLHGKKSALLRSFAIRSHATIRNELLQSLPLRSRCQFQSATPQRQTVILADDLAGSSVHSENTACAIK